MENRPVTFPAGRPAPWGPGATRKMGPPFRSVPVPEGPRNPSLFTSKIFSCLYSSAAQAVFTLSSRNSEVCPYLSGKSPEFGY
jgi:hypothetical protein